MGPLPYYSPGTKAGTNYGNGWDAGNALAFLFSTATDGFGTGTPTSYIGTKDGY